MKKLRLPFLYTPKVISVGAGFSDYQYYGAYKEETLPQSAKNKDFDYRDRYFHGGIDFRVPAHTPVVSMTRGIPRLVGKKTKHHTTIQIEEIDRDGCHTGRKFTYSHLDPNSLHSTVLNQYLIEEGDYIGCVVPWLLNEPGVPPQIDVCDGKLFTHLHLDISRKTTGGLERHFNPLFEFDFDMGRPVIDRVYFVPRGSTRATSHYNLSGGVEIVVEAHNKAYSKIINEDGTEGRSLWVAPFKLGIYKAGYEIIKLGDISPLLTEETTPFDYLDFDLKDRAAYSKDVILHELTIDGQRVRSQGDRFKRRSFWAISRYCDGEVMPNSAWFTQCHSNGTYMVRVWVENEKGLRTSKTELVRLNNDEK